jgi:uncharacterized membrane protein YkvI
MGNVPALLARIPDEFKPVAAIGIGAIMLVFIVLLHGTGLHSMLVLRQRWERRLRRGRPYIFAVLLLFGWSVFCANAIVGISELFTMAWTTSALVGVVSSHRQLLEQIEVLKIPF